MDPFGGDDFLNYLKSMRSQKANAGMNFLRKLGEIEKRHQRTMAKMKAKARTLIDRAYNKAINDVLELAGKEGGLAIETQLKIADLRRKVRGVDIPDTPNQSTSKQ